MIDSSSSSSTSVSWSLPKASRALLLATLLLSALFFLVPSTTEDLVRQFLALYPGLLQPPTLRVWTLLTFALYHENVLELATSIVLYVCVGWYVEPVWGAHELLRFVAIVVLASGFGTCVAAYLLHTVTPTWLAGFHDQILYDSPIHGAAPILAGFAVVGKQLFPEHSLNEFLALRLKTAPALLGGLYITGALLGFHVMRLAPTLFGLVTAWIYLRFVQISPSTGLKGDASDHFSFASFFPEAIRPFVARLVGGGGVAASRRPVTILPLTGGGGVSSSNSTAPSGVHSADADRRRLLAQVALDERLKEKRGGAHGSS
jgi:membrane associated rhomboid family serine protease